MKKIFLIAVCVLCIGSFATAQISTPLRIELQGSGLGNFYRIDEGVYRSDQPSSVDFQLLEAFGIREVLNLRNYHSDSFEARKTSLTLHRLNTRASKIDENDIVVALRIINQRKGPILVHCWHGSDRTGAVLAMYRIVFQGWDKERAIEELTSGGFGFHEQFDQIPAMIRRADINAIKTRVFEKK